jgi:hypothetical protein
MSQIKPQNIVLKIHISNNYFRVCIEDIYVYYLITLFSLD